MEQNVKHCSSAYVRPAENKANFMFLVHDFASSFYSCTKENFLCCFDFKVFYLMEDACKKHKAGCIQ